MTKRALNIDAIANAFTPIWRSKNYFKDKKEGDHIVLFTFDDKTEMEKIMVAKLWSFDKHLMLLQYYDKETDLANMKFNRVAFWVQVHDIPLRFRTQKVAEWICETIGTVTEAPVDAEVEGDGFIRVRVTLNISKPLCHGRVISLENGKELWVSFKYKRLPNMCYWCGCLTHDDRDYEMWIESEGSLSVDSRRFGS